MSVEKTLNLKPVAIIPARGNSKRLPRKNILPWKGTPLIGHTIKNAIASNIFSEVIVSSEDDEILSYAREYGAKTVRRRSTLSQDSSTVVEVCTDVINTYKSIDSFCCIYATAVKLRPITIANSFFDFSDTQKSDFLMGVSLYNYPPQQALVESNSGNLQLLNPSFKGIQSQKFQNCYVSNGTFYWSRAKSFLLEKSFYGIGLRPFLVPEDQVSDINTEEDYKNLIKN